MKEGAYKKYLLSMLMVIMAFNYVDRLALGLLLQDIKGDLALSDTQLGLMTGIAFALFYSVVGVPIARWADRGNRITIVTWTTALWSVAVALCGMAGSFVQLLLIRVGVAIGEAGCVPTGHSLIADHFNRAERPRAVAMYNLGGPLSIVFGYFVAGWLNELYGWRMTFMLLGLPGVALAVLARLTLREPRVHAPAISSRSTATNEGEGTPVAQPSMKEVCIVLWGNRTFRHLLFGYSVALFFSSGIGQWTPAFFMRSYGLQTGELGTWFALVSGVGGLIGTYAGGVLASRHATHNERLQLKAIAVIYCLCVVLAVCMFFYSLGVHLTFAVMGLIIVVSGTISAPMFATIQSLVPDRMRAMSIAILFLFGNLIGLGLGPLAVGVLSDAFAHWAGEGSLRYALLALSPGYLWVGWHFWRASSTVARDLGSTQHNCEQPEGARREADDGFEPMSARPVPSK